MLALVWVYAIALAGCSNCTGGEQRGKKARPEIDPQKRLHDEVEARLADRKIDLKKAYPKDDKGQVTCGDDSSCFITLVERCEPALFTHKVANPGLMFVEHSEAIYRVAGKRPQGCAIQRARVKVEQRLGEDVRAVLVKQGKDEAWIAKQHDEALAVSLSGNPRRLECVLKRDNALALALDVADKGYVPQHFKQPGCTQSPEESSWPSELSIAEAPTEGAALAEPDAGAGKTKPAE